MLTGGDLKRPLRVPLARRVRVVRRRFLRPGLLTYRNYESIIPRRPAGVVAHYM